MGKALVVYESMFGNTRDVAEAIAEGLASHGHVEALEVGEAPTAVPAEVDLLVAGGPTHAFGMSREGTRGQAAGETPQPLVSTRIGLREWLGRLEVRPGLAVATFDTSFKKIRRFGTAGRGAQKRLKRLGLSPAAPPESFYVKETTGPLLDGELERARAWGSALGAATIGAVAAPSR